LLNKVHSKPKTKMHWPQKTTYKIPQKERCIENAS